MGAILCFTLLSNYSQQGELAPDACRLFRSYGLAPGLGEAGVNDGAVAVGASGLVDGLGEAVYSSYYCYDPPKQEDRFTSAEPQTGRGWFGDENHPEYTPHCS